MALENCTLCRGTGWKLVPRMDAAAGKVAVPCDCGMQERAVRAMKRARIPKRYEDCDFESYVTDLTDGRLYTPKQTSELKQAKLLVEKFVQNYPGADHSGILLMGPPGVGKTHLAIAALKELLHRGHTGLFCEYGALLRNIQETYRREGEVTESTILEPLLSIEVLVIDDLGFIRPSDWVLDTIGHILNARYTHSSRDLSRPRCTIMTTNRSDESSENKGTLPTGRPITVHVDSLSERIGEATRSRLYEVCRTIEFSRPFPDFRREIRQVGRARA